ncbi:hypothetical protein OROGR_019439 [Orobanche gracilis]
MKVSSFSTSCIALRQSPSEVLLPRKTWFPKRNQVHLFPKERALTWRRNHFQVLNCQLKEVAIIEAGCMDEIYNILAERLVPVAAAESNPNFK